MLNFKGKYMTINVQEDKTPAKQIFAEGKGKYTVVDGNKIFEFYFPIQSTLAINYDVLSFLKDEIFKAMEDQQKKEKSDKEEEKDKIEK